MHKVNLLSSEGRASNLFEYYAESRQQMHKVNLLSSESRTSNLFEYYAESRQQMFKVKLLSYFLCRWFRQPFQRKVQDLYMVRFLHYPRPLLIYQEIQ